MKIKDDGNPDWEDLISTESKDNLSQFEKEWLSSQINYEEPSDKALDDMVQFVNALYAMRDKEPVKEEDQHILKEFVVEDLEATEEQIVDFNDHLKKTLTTEELYNHLEPTEESNTDINISILVYGGVAIVLLILGLTFYG
jgi:hypothetical protein